MAKETRPSSNTYLLLHGGSVGREGNAILYFSRSLVLVRDATYEGETGRGVEETKALFLFHLVKPIEAAEQS